MKCEVPEEGIMELFGVKCLPLDWFIIIHDHLSLVPIPQNNHLATIPS